jgi:flagellar biosynthesis/type III secretory pathway protein FliH
MNGRALFAGRDAPRLVADPALGRGECRVECRESMLLSDVTRELHEIRDELLRSLAHARS